MNFYYGEADGYSYRSPTELYSEASHEELWTCAPCAASRVSFHVQLIEIDEAAVQ